MEDTKEETPAPPIDPKLEEILTKVEKELSSPGIQEATKAKIQEID